MFISCASCTEVVTQQEMAKVFYKLQKGQLKIIALVDNDPDRIDKHSDWIAKGIKILSRREIENYLFDYEIAKNQLKTDLTENEYYSKLGADKNNFNQFDVKEALNQSLRQEMFKIKDFHKLKIKLAESVSNSLFHFEELRVEIFD